MAEAVEVEEEGKATVDEAKGSEDAALPQSSAPPPKLRGAEDAGNAPMGQTQRRRPHLSLACEWRRQREPA